MTPRLTIAIPTYNRPAQLRATLEIILPQVLACDQVQLLLLDNHSETPVKTVVDALLPVANGRVKVVRNSANVGANANIMRCFELCETEWLWILGDDDTPTANAVKNILEDAGGSHCYAYYWVPKIQKPVFKSEDTVSVAGRSFDDLCGHFEGDFLQLLFISAAVYNARHIKPYLRAGYLSANTGMPHILMVIKALSKGESWLLSRKTIVNYNNPPFAEVINTLGLAYALPTLLSCVSERDETLYALEIIRKRCTYLGSPFLTLYHMIDYHHFSKACAELCYLYGVMQKIYGPSVLGRPVLWVKWRIAALGLLWPKGYVGLIRLYERSSGRRLPRASNNRM